MEHFFPFFITLLAGLFFSVTFKKVQIPWVVSLIVAGIAIGPHGLGWFEVNQTVEFISESGLVLLMFMAGLETQLSSLKKFQGKMYFLALINGAIPFAVGAGIGTFFGLGLVPTILMGIIFLSSSVAVVIPTLEATGLIKTPLGSSVLATSIVQDVASLVLLSVFLQSEQHLSNIPLYIFYPLVFIVLVVIRWLLPRMQKQIFLKAIRQDDLFQRDLRVVLLMLFGIVIVFELLGLHPIIAGFFTGLSLSESLKSEILLGKIRAISYGIFIPTFFIVVGIKTNLGQLLYVKEDLLLTGVIVGGSILSKLLSGTLGAKLVGFEFKQSVFFGATSIPQLSTTLAATFTGMELGLIDSPVVTAMVVLSIVSTIVGPLLMSSLNRYVLSGSDLKKTVK